MAPLPGLRWLLIASLSRAVFAAVDSNGFAVFLPVEIPYASDGLPPFMDFSEPANGAASYISASDSWQAPYPAKVTIAPNSTVCTAQYATRCSIQAAVDLIAYAMDHVCAGFSTDGNTSTIAEDVDVIAAEVSSMPDLGIFVLDENFTIIADTLDSFLIGEPVDGLAASGRSVQPRFRERLLWVVGSASGSPNSGGFVPHFSARLSTLGSDTSDGYTTPVPVSSYFQRCLGPSSTLYFGASVRRQAVPVEEACDPMSNNNCNIYNTESMVGLALLDFLSVKDEDDYQKLVFEMVYGDTYSVAGVAPVLVQVVPDSALSSSVSLNPTLGTVLADQSNRSHIGRTLSIFSDTFAPSALRGGGWVKTVETSMSEDDSDVTVPGETTYNYQATLVAGVVFGDTAHAIAAGFTHTPQEVPQDFQCAPCTGDFTACAFQTMQYLSSHGQADSLLASSASDAFWRITNLSWLGADHPHAVTTTIDNVEMGSHWPQSLTLAVFDSDGLCVADGADPTRVGEHFGVRTGEFPSWDSMQMGLRSGIGFIEYLDVETGVLMFAKVTRMVRFQQEYFLLSTLAKETPVVENSSFDIVEPAVGEWIEAEALRWASILALTDPSSWYDSGFALISDFPSGNGLWAGLWGADWENLFPKSNWQTYWIMDKRQNLDADEIKALDSVSSTRGGWVTMPNSTRERPHRAFVLSFRQDYGTEVRVVIGYHGKLGEATCDKGCLQGSYCALNGTCACYPGRNWNLVMDDTCSNGFGETVLRCTLDNPPCPDELFDDLEKCNFCKAGYYCPSNYLSFECPIGYYCPAQSRAPMPCAGGTWAPNTTATSAAECIPCDAGSYRDSSMLSGCQICRAGYFQSSQGETSCDRCGFGFYQNSTGASSCYSCGNGRTTRGTGYTTAEECICPSNTYTVPIGDSDTRCQSCGIGSSCAGYGAEPEALEGYYLDEITPTGLSVFECKDTIYCPGGPVRTCSDGRTGIACARCLADMTPSNDGSCRDCVFLDKFLLWGAAVVLAIALAILYYGVATSDRANQNHSTLLAVICASQLVTLAQTLNVLSSMQVEWKKPLSNFLELFKFMAFDITELRVSCHITVEPFDSYLLRLFVPLMTVAFISIIHFFSTIVWYGAHFSARVPTLLGAMGSIFMAFSISVVLSTLMPVQCFEHPNGRWTIHQSMSELCWEGTRHTSMVIAGGVACILPVLFLVAVIYILISFPQRIREGDVRFLNIAQFLLFRYQPSARWCALFLIIRNMLVAVVPSVPDPVYQVVLLQVISLVGLIIVLQYKPCRIAFANISELGLCLGTLLAGSLASFFVDDKDLDSISKLAMGIIMTGAVLFPIGIALGIYRLLRQTKQKTYHFFLCHHKAGAGALARLMKMELCRSESSLRGDVFIDSDNLDNLDKLFDFVAQETQTLVAISSAELYKRPWCVGEVTTAYNKDVKVVPLYLTDFSPLTDDFIEDISDVVDLSCVFEQGIALHNIQKALLWVRSLGGLTMPSCVNVRVLGELAKALFHQSALKDKDSLYTRSIVGGKLSDNAIVSHVETRLTNASHRTASNGHSSQPSTTSRELANKPPAAVIVDTDNSEAMCSARILIDLLAIRFGDSFQGPVLFSDAMLEPTKSLQLLPSVSRLTMICSINCWSSLPFLMDAIHGYWTGLEMLPIVVDEGYKYPTDPFFLELDDFGRRMCRMFDVSENPDLLRNIVQSVFKNIASHFHVLGSMELLNTQADNIARRLKAVHSPTNSAHKKTGDEQDKKRVWCAEFVQAVCANSMGAPGRDAATLSYTVAGGGPEELCGMDALAGHVITDVV